MGDIDFSARLLELARAQAAAKAAEAAYTEAMQTHVAPVAARMEAAQNEAARLERKLREDTLAYVQETGDLTPHPSITFRRSWKWQYDREAALAYVISIGRKDLYRDTASLNVRAFEMALEPGDLTNFDAEKVNAPTVAIAKLGALLIEAEVDAREDGEK